MAEHDLIYCGYKADRIYRVIGISNTLRDGIYLSTDAHATDPRGVTMDASGNLIWSDDDYGSEKAWKEVGYSMGANNPIDLHGTDSGPRDCKWYNGNLYNVDDGTNRANKYSGFSSTILDYTVLPAGNSSPTGMTMDDSGNLMTGDVNFGKCFRYTGFSNTLDTFFVHTDGDPSGLDWYDGNLYTVDVYGNTLYKHSGFSATIIDSHATVCEDPAGLHYEIAGAAGTSIPVVMHHLRQMGIS